ncbi:FAD/NAD(P)-binding domain-containing protein [Polychaeton citri CBS 116435]|uniref:FAD/NAD(P)-binding domain-containing protein n=1 Tax=Polychaeton citri CBS 116435 TaxID=1314669 RepID=A0A9P4QCX3_9PEZI|nr:FAD/NAD(P)-binding domain-containing protein [Polychaeton citri CBS 116435]
MAEQRNVVILGASFGGLSAAHYFLKHTLPTLKTAKDAEYALHVVDPSTHFWWHHGAPREIVSIKQMPHDKYFVSIESAFKQYASLKDSIHVHHATATGLDAEKRQVIFKPHGSDVEETLPYYALVIATGVRSPTPLTTLQGDYTITQRALEEMNTILASAKEVVIGGGGPIAVETAGEIGAHLKGKGAKVTIVTSGNKLLPVLGKKFSDKAHKMLTKVGVTVVYNTKIETADPSANGKTDVKLSNGETIAADAYIPAVGVTPNTEFLPANLKTAAGWVDVNAQTLRVDVAGQRVYAAGDVAAVDQGGALNLFKTIPIVGNNMRSDLFAAAKVGGTVAEKKFIRKDSETQLVPVGPGQGVGAFNGFGMPSFMVASFKGKDYMQGQMSDIVVTGNKWKKA